MNTETTDVKTWCLNCKFCIFDDCHGDIKQFSAEKVSSHLANCECKCHLPKAPEGELS
jgi:hypothetical protein